MTLPAFAYASFQNLKNWVLIALFSLALEIQELVRVAKLVVDLEFYRIREGALRRHEKELITLERSASRIQELREGYDYVNLSLASFNSVVSYSPQKRLVELVSIVK